MTRYRGFISVVVIVTQLSDTIALRKRTQPTTQPTVVPKVWMPVGIWVFTFLQICLTKIGLRKCPTTQVSGAPKRAIMSSLVGNWKPEFRFLE